MLEKLIYDGLFLWVTIDPIGTLAIFAAVTTKLTPEQRKKTAVKAALYSLAILLGAIIIGELLLVGLNIQVRSLQLGGAIILLLFGIKMVFGNIVERPPDPSEGKTDLAVYPLAMPTIASPGAIMAVIVITDSDRFSIPEQAVTALLVVAILAVTVIFMLASDRIIKVIGQNGAAVLVRVMGLVLVALSVELVAEALGLDLWVTE